MPHINLMPWREKLRNRELKLYQGLLAGVATGAVIVVYGVGAGIDHMINTQQARNRFLSQQIAVVDQKIAMIRSIKEKRQSLQIKINLIEQLQEDRNLTTAILSEIVTITPPGIHLQQLKRKSHQLRLEGKSESNNRLSEMMRRVKKSQLLQHPAIEAIVAEEGTQRPVSSFVMTIQIANPNDNRETGKS